MSAQAKKTLLTFGTVFVLAVVALASVGTYVAQMGRTEDAPPETTNSEATAPVEPTAEDCLASIDPETGEQTDPACPSPESEEASATASIAQLHKLSPSCEPPTRLHKGTKECELVDEDGDGVVVLQAPLSLSSFTKLNCKGLKLLPTSTGTPGAAAVPAGTFTRSVPAVAILVKEAYGVKVQNCIIGDESRPFDFGIWVLTSKTPEEYRDEPGAKAILTNKILNNTFVSRYTGVELMKSDNTLIADNKITFGIGAPGAGIRLVRDNDDNKVVNNTIEAHSLVVANSAPIIPLAQPNVKQVNGIFISNPPAAVFPTLVIDGEFIPIPATASMLDSSGQTLLGSCQGATGSTPGTCSGDAGVKCRDNFDCGLSVNNLTSELLSEDNLFDGNTIDFKDQTWVSQFRMAGHQANGLEGVAGVSGNRYLDNIVRVAGDGVHSSAQIVFTLAGTCSADSSRYCGSDTDCSKANVDKACAVSADCGVNESCANGRCSKGACIGVRVIEPRSCSGGTNARKFCTTNSDCPGSACGTTVRGWCSGGTDAGKSCTSAANCAGGGTCAPAGWCDIGANKGKSCTTNANCGTGATCVSSSVNLGQKDALMQNNRIEGPVEYGFRIARSSINIQLIGNSISNASVAGIAVANNALESTSVIRNKVNGTAGGARLRLEVSHGRPVEQARSYDSIVSLNDFTGSASQAIAMAGNYLFPTELSDLQRGNYWGRTCSDSQGFRDSDEPDAAGKTDSPFSHITDSHPYGQPVAGTPDSSLPSTCK